MKIFDKTRHNSSKNYISYQKQISQKHLLPLFRSLNIPLDRPILDIGCNKGGCVIAFASLLGTSVTGIDISQENVEIARLAAFESRVDADFQVVDITKDNLPEKKYGLLLLRDVVEHLSDVETSLLRLHSMLVDDGFLYIVFPPWYGPYAGHQHNAKSVVRFMPYLHALYPKLFLHLLHQWEAERTDWLADEIQICKNHLTRKQFERILARTGWSIQYRQTYFIRPAFMRMGLPTMPNGFIGRLPLFGEPLSTACEYLLTPSQA